MVILQDSREQSPLHFDLDSIVTEVVVDTLPVGDYSARYVSGRIAPVYVERKGLGDLFTTMTSGYPRFKREMQRAKDYRIQLILAIEGSLDDVYCGVRYSRFAGSSCVQKLFTLAVRYDVYPVFCQSRGEMALWIRELYEAIGRQYRVQERRQPQ